MVSRFVIVLSLVGMLAAQCDRYSNSTNITSAISSSNTSNYTDTDCTCDGTATYNPLTFRC